MNEKKKIALFGASGQTGIQFLVLALDAGYSIKALVRNPDKLRVHHPALEVVVGDVLHSKDVSQTIAGCDVVFSLFGHVKDSPEWLQSDGTQHIVEAMQNLGVNKVVSLSGGGLPFPEKDRPRFADKMIRFIMKIAVPKLLNDAIRHHRVLERSGKTWVIVRGPRLTNAAPKGSYRVGWVGSTGSTQIARGDLAHFLLTQIEDTQYHFQMPFVTY